MESLSLDDKNNGKFATQWKRSTIGDSTPATEYTPDLHSTTSFTFLHNLSCPPTYEELSNYIDIPSSQLPPIHKRQLSRRVFVNRDIGLNHIQFYGFDMDYTLAEYISPSFEELAYTMCLERLLSIGYPPSIKQLKYDPSFPIRGLFLDKECGNLLKVDSFGNIIRAVHGRHKLTKEETMEVYPSMYIHGSDISSRFYLLNSLFTLPEACLYGDLVDHLECNTPLTISDDVTENSEVDPSHIASRSGSHSLHGDLSYTNLFQDIRFSMDYIHNEGQLKTEVLKDISKYIYKHPKFGTLLIRMKQAGAKVFLLTNSEYYYTNQIMTYLLSPYDDAHTSWRDYFDIIIVGADKPRFFGEGNTIREVDIERGTLLISKMKDSFEPGKVYHGGSLPLFQKLTGAKGNKVLYIGDHIFADIIQSKKTHGWRNLLVVPELIHELQVWELNQDKYNHLLNLEFIKAEIFRGLDSQSTQPPDISDLRKHIKKTIEEVDTRYNPYFGSLFRSGTKHSFFAMQVQRYADLYTSSFLNLLNYPLFYQFSANTPSLAHDTPYKGTVRESNIDKDPLSK